MCLFWFIVTFLGLVAESHWRMRAVSSRRILFLKANVSRRLKKKIGYWHQNQKRASRPAVWIQPESIWLIVLVRDKIKRATLSPGSPDQRWDEMGEKRGAMCEFCQAESSPALNSIIWSKTASMLTTLPVPFCGELQTGWAIQAASCFLCYWSTSNQAAGSLVVLFFFFDEYTRFFL